MSAEELLPQVFGSSAHAAIKRAAWSLPPHTGPDRGCCYHFRDKTISEEASSLWPCPDVKCPVSCMKVPGNVRGIRFKGQELYLAQGSQRRKNTCLEEETEGRDTPELSWGREPPAASVKQLPTHLAVCEGSPYILKCPACPGDSPKSHKCPALFGGNAWVGFDFLQASPPILTWK